MSQTENNKIMVVVALLATAFLVASVFQSTVALSYIAVLFILSVLSVAGIESNDREFDISPYGGVIVSLGIILLLGMTGIWLTWDPGVSAAEYTYIIGLPTPTAIYLFFIWFLPFFVTIYYALSPFNETVNDDIIDSILDDAQEAQTTSEFPMAAAEQPAGDD
ncbi:hypothetical protein [Natrinema sp. 1APR25-10V2]|uniref:hypothetical protein n=1 Tax=Natrinema sp. 1APR25-10V2 TaxID=2951081 RepID=UPI002873F428|nr:hypothetical protein [Natrinema sp. 1APR25-10V2]MDS0476970.1 hypothetical protein [Natrinema sp. 1APR25-10V2]